MTRFDFEALSQEKLSLAIEFGSAVLSLSGPLLTTEEFASS